VFKAATVFLEEAERYGLADDDVLLQRLAEKGHATALRLVSGDDDHHQRRRRAAHALTRAIFRLRAWGQARQQVEPVTSWMRCRVSSMPAALATNPAQGSTCCCLLPHHPHRRHHPARRQCPCNCDARTAFSGRAKKKRRGSPGGFPRRLEADVQCSRSMHRND
jgi:hypothetical protein